MSQLYRAWRASGMTLDQFLDATGLKISKSSVSRKLRGLLGLSDEEATEFRRVLKQSISSTPRAPSRRRRAA